MAFDIENHSFPAADIRYACSFTRALEHTFSLGGELFQDGFGVFVAAVFGPQNGEKSGFGVIGQAAQFFHDPGVFFIRKSHALVELVPFDLLGAWFPMHKFTSLFFGPAWPG